jgi:polysaccharide deacetylase 2 family uncharacterized protein YibQ
MNWLSFFAPILAELAKGLVGIIVDLIETWAAELKDKPTSGTKKAKAMTMARALSLDLDEDQLDAAIEMQLQAKKAIARKVGKTAGVNTSG